MCAGQNKLARNLVAAGRCIVGPQWEHLAETPIDTEYKHTLRAMFT